MPVVGALAAALLASGADRGPTGYEASALLVVPAASPATEEVPGLATTPTTLDVLGRPSEAQRLAGTYATLIPADEATLAEVASSMGIEANELRGDLTAAAVLDSSLVRVTLHASSAEVTTAGVEALARALTGPDPASPAIAPGSLVLVSTDEPSAVGGLPSGAIPAAAVAGALLGAFAAFAWTRQDPRVDSAADLDPLDLPAIELTTIDRQRARAAVSGVLVASGFELSGDKPVHLLAVNGPSDPSTARLAAVLPSRLGQVGPPRIHLAAGDDELRLGPPVYYGGVVTTAPSPVALGEPGIAVVVARRGARLVEVARCVATVERFGSVVAGVLVCARDASSGSGSASRSAVATHSTAGVDAPQEEGSPLPRRNGGTGGSSRGSAEVVADEATRGDRAVESSPTAT